MMKKKAGFTLIELLIVIAIIGILSTLALSNYTKYKKNATLTVVENSIVECIRELTAEYTNNSNVTTLECKIPKENTQNTVTLTLDTASGTVTKTINNLTYQTYHINCDIIKNSVTCQLTD